MAENADNKAPREIPRLYQIRVDGFKALQRLKMNTSDHLTLLIGTNGAGKSSILQALGFFRYIVENRGAAFFEERGWDPQDIRFRSNPRGRSTVVQLSVLFQIGIQKVRWDIDWGLNTGSIFREMVRRRFDGNQDIDTLLSFTAKDGGTVANGPDLPPFLFSGSLIPAFESLVENTSEGIILKKLLDWATGIRSLELMTPHAMKVSGTRLSRNDMGIKGDRLAGFLASLSADQKSRVVQRVGILYPLNDLTTVKKRAGWIDLQVAERYRQLSNIPAIHMSDGFMRLLALCAIPELGDQVSLVLLDELEDGIEPHILPRMMDLLVRESAAQIIATSHSPLLVNHVGVDDVRFVSRDTSGRTVAKPASEMPAFKVGAEFFGAGEMWTSSPPEVLQSEATHNEIDEPESGVDGGKEL